MLIKNGIAVSMDGKSAWRDNVFVERLWRSVKYEEVYLRAYEGVSDARASIGRYLDFYNGRRPHSSLDGITITPTSRRCLSAWQPNPGRAPHIEAEKLFRQPGPALLGSADGGVRDTLMQLFAFILMPFARTNKRYEAIKRAVRQAEMHGERVDKQSFHRQGITDKILQRIKELIL